MSNSYNENDPRLRQDKIEIKDKENSSAGMIAGVIVVIIAIVGIYMFYKYELAPTTPVVTSQPENSNSVPSNNERNLNQNSSPNSVPENNQNNVSGT